MKEGDIYMRGQYHNPNENWQHGDYRDPDNYATATKIIYIAMIAIAIVLVIGFFCSCQTPKVVTVPEVHHEYHHTTDTIRERDSVTTERITTIRELDSTAMANYGIRLRNAERAWLVETNELKTHIAELERLRQELQAHQDSVPYPVPIEVPVEVPAQLTMWQNIQMWAGRAAIFATVLLLLAAYIKKKS